MKNLLTMVVPTHERHYYLERVMLYYRYAPFNSIVTDSSMSKYSGEIYDSFQYIHSNEGFIKKLLKAVERVSTKYIFLCADDDFTSIKALEKCVEYMEVNIDYVAVQGRASAFRIKEKTVKKSPLYTHSLKFNVTSDLIDARVRELMVCYVPFVYAVVRTEVLVRLLKAMVKNEISEPVLIEIGLALGMAMHGKLGILKILYSLREKLPGSAGKTAKNLVAISNDANSRDEYSRFEMMLNDILLFFVGEQIDQAKKIVQNGLSAYRNEFLLMRKRRCLKRKRVLNVIKGFLSCNNLKALMSEKLREIEDIDLFFDVVNESGYPYSWDTESLEVWEEIISIVKNYQENTTLIVQ